MKRRSPPLPASRRFEPAESEALRKGFRLIAGVDEAGRGCLAGPVSVGLAIFSPQFFQTPYPAELDILDDSKKLTPARREKLFPVVRHHTLFSCVVHISSREVDRRGINPATEFAVERALVRAEQAGFSPALLLMDGNYRFPRLSSLWPGLEVRPEIDGDARIFSIAAASILAKVSRDRRMERYELLFPGYGLGSHKGYGTKAHREAIRERGPLPLHRRSYRW